MRNASKALTSDEGRLRARLRRMSAPTLAAAWLLAAAPAGAAAANVETATPEQSANASDKYRAGMGLFQAEKFAEALDTFKQSYDVVASPNSHLMIVRSLAKMGKVAQAYAEIDAVIREAEKAAEKSDKYKKTLDAARSERDDLKNKVGFVVVNVDASVTVGGRALESAEIGRRIPVDPGSTEVVLKLPSGEEERRKVDVEPGRESKIDIAPPAASRAAPAAAAAPCPAADPVVRESGIDQRTLAVVAGAVGVAGFATFAVFGILDNAKYNDLRNGCPSGVCPRALSNDAETGRTYQTFANVGLGVGIVGAVSSVVLLVTAPRHSAERTGFAPAPAVAVGPGSISVKGAF